MLNFQGRVTESSVKNFQLCSNETNEDVVLQFGRVGKEKFTMDVKYPLSPFQAFAICVACMDGKIADRQGYDMLRRITGGTFGGGGGGARNDSDDSSQSKGSIAGSKTLSGSIKESLPSSSYFFGSIARSFK